MIRRPAFQRWSPRTDAVTRRREPLSDVGSDRCLHLGDNRTVLPSLPRVALPRTLGTFLTCSSYRHFGSTPFQIEASVRTDYPVELHQTATFFFSLHCITCIINCIYVFSLHKCLFFSLVAVYLQLFELSMLNVTMLFNRIVNSMCLHNTL